LAQAFWLRAHWTGRVLHRALFASGLTERFTMVGPFVFGVCLSITTAIADAVACSRGSDAAAGSDAAECAVRVGSAQFEAGDTTSESGIGNSRVIEKQNAGSSHSEDSDVTNLMQVLVPSDLREDLKNTDDSVESTSESTVGSRDRATTNDEMLVSGVDGLGKVTADGTVSASRGGSTNTPQLNFLLLRDAVRPVASREGGDSTSRDKATTDDEMLVSGVDGLGKVTADGTVSASRSRFAGCAATNARNTSTPSDPAVEFYNEIDMNGRPCSFCGEPLPERVDKNYTKRTDCGNHSLLEHPEVLERPLVDFNRPATGGKSATNAWCELNVQTVCADSLYNRDFLYQAKVFDAPRNMEFTYDFWYCKYNGFLEPEIRALQNDFDGMQAKAAQFCEERTDWRSITMKQMLQEYAPGVARGRPTEEEARFLGSWLCAMGSAGCDMAYCAYTYCDKGGDAFGVYEECEGWDPVKGM